MLTHGAEWHFRYRDYHTSAPRAFRISTRFPSPTQGQVASASTSRDCPHVRLQRSRVRARATRQRASIVSLCACGVCGAAAACHGAALFTAGDSRQRPAEPRPQGSSRAPPDRYPGRGGSRGSADRRWLIRWYPLTDLQLTKCSCGEMSRPGRKRGEIGPTDGCR